MIPKLEAIIRDRVTIAELAREMYLGAVVTSRMPGNTRQDGLDFAEAAKVALMVTAMSATGEDIAVNEFNDMSAEAGLVFYKNGGYASKSRLAAVTVTLGHLAAAIAVTSVHAKTPDALGHLSRWLLSVMAAVYGDASLVTTIEMITYAVERAGDKTLAELGNEMRAEMRAEVTGA